MRLALYGGTFDPIHNGHLIMARDAMELLNLDRVVFLPAAISPHKLNRAPVPAEIRRAMVEVAIRDEPGFALDDRELHRPGPSYTVDTVEEIRAECPGCELFYLIGHDNVAKLHTWHRIDDLQKQVEFVVFGRGEESGEHGFRKLSRRLDISATEVRQRVARGLSIRYLVPDPVRLLIEQYCVYISDSDDS
ncbi:MAG: nicotinate (nicotinamide) nucleotide adenylyltransferase [Verrucomicrobiaceae bacterium]|nr:MAG: nicotinate (nicotinamide) nucleotide adenylyltransferase [Verrucomicrobiaceae bacterium]